MAGSLKGRGNTEIITKKADKGVVVVIMNISH